MEGEAVTYYALLFILVITHYVPLYGGFFLG